MSLRGPRGSRFEGNAAGRIARWTTSLTEAKQSAAMADACSHLFRLTEFDYDCERVDHDESSGKQAIRRKDEQKAVLGL